MPNKVTPSMCPKQFVVFAQLIGGLGPVPFYFDVRFPQTGELVHTTNVQLLNFPHRDKLVQQVYAMKNCPFPQPGIYLVELYCVGQWVADTGLALLVGVFPMKKRPSNPLHQPETKFIGEVQKFSGTVFSPDDPRLEPRVRRGRPGNSNRLSGKKPRKRKET